MTGFKHISDVKDPIVLKGLGGRGLKNIKITMKKVEKPSQNAALIQTSNQVVLGRAVSALSNRPSLKPVEKRGSRPPSANSVNSQR